VTASEAQDALASTRAFVDAVPRMLEQKPPNRLSPRDLCSMAANVRAHSIALRSAADGGLLAGDDAGRLRGLADESDAAAAIFIHAADERAKAADKQPDLPQAGADGSLGDE
jgi:hypothetical protein